MNVLIAVASRHGATRGIADTIADELAALGVIADVRDAGDQSTVCGYDAIVIGSAIYMGSWLPAARQLVERTRAGLVGVPVWLFSSGPLGHDDPQPQGDPTHLDELIAATAAHGHQTFVGKLDMRALGPVERLMVRAVKAPEGDFRDWDAVRAWAREIGAVLQSEATALV